MNIFFFIYSVISSISTAHAGTEQMRAMPILKEAKSYTVPSKEAGEDLQDQRGFGDQESSVGMMNLMMVEGSGYEGMDMGDMKMGKMKMADNKAPGAGTSMKVGGMKMEGMKMDDDASKTSAASAQGAAGLAVEMRKSPPRPKIGANVYEFAVKDKDGKPAKGLKLIAQVYMLSMDMGTEKPRVREVSPGVYQTKASFSMAGPWALKIVGPAGEKVIEIKVEK